MTSRRRASNLGIWLANVTLAAVIFTAPDELREPWPTWVAGFVAGFLVLDFLSYWVHRAQHAVPTLWRLHALHHSDPDVDATTAVRHHPLEYLIASAFFWIAVLLLRFPAPVVAVHGAAVFVLAIATHTGRQWPEWLERIARPVIITLGLHLVHHSIEDRDLNRNFGGVLSVWDRLFRTYEPARTIAAFGVAGLDRADTCRPIAMLLTPWRLQ